MHPHPALSGPTRTDLRHPPTACGYLNPWNCPTSNEIANARRIIEAAARTTGLHLGSILVEDARQHPTIALDLTVHLAATAQLNAVIVPSIESLGRLPRAREAVRARLEHDAGLRIVIALDHIPRLRGDGPPHLRRARPIAQRTVPTIERA